MTEPGWVQQLGSRWFGALIGRYRQRRFVVAHIVLTGLAVVLAFMPLFNLLGYEFSLTMAIVATLLLGPVTAGAFARDPKSEGGCGTLQRGPIDTWLRLTGLNLGLLVPPLLVISLNSLRVPNCDYTGGLAAYIVLPGVTVLWATLVAMITTNVVGPRRWLGHLLYYGLVLGSVAGTLTYLALEPPIVAVNPWFGYFAGSLYDEALALPLPLLFYRGLQLLLMLALLTGLQLAWHVRERTPFPPGLRALCLFASIAVVVGHSQHAALGFSLTRTDIEAELGGVHETEHFTIHYSSGGDWPERIEQIGEDHEFRYWQMTEFFGNEPEGAHVRSYIYPDRETKGRLMGARRTLVAKLWLGEMHIIYKGFGDDLVAHELAHLFTEPFGSGPLRLSTQAWVLPNMGLVEGIAAAAQWPVEDLSPHGWAAALHRLELAPDVGAVLGAGGFWSKQSRTVYTLMGSFVRWLIETRGIDKFKLAYAHGEIEEVYETSLTELVGEWRGFLETIDLSESDLALANYRFDRPSIFGKVCARNIAERKRVVDALSSAGRDDDAIREMKAVIDLDPDSPAHRHELMRLLVKAERYDEAKGLARELLDTEGLGAVRHNQIRHELGDIYWRADDIEGALLVYSETLAEIGLPSDIRRQLAVKIHALTHPAEREAFFEYFLEEGGHAAKIALLYRVRLAVPDSHVVAYVLGLRLAGIRRYEDALPHFAMARSGELPSEDLRNEAAFVHAQTLYFLTKLDEAEQIFAALSSEVRLEGQRARADEWLLRVQWKRGRK